MLRLRSERFVFRSRWRYNTSRVAPETPCMAAEGRKIRMDGSCAHEDAALPPHRVAHKTRHSPSRAHGGGDSASRHCRHVARRREEILRDMGDVHFRGVQSVARKSEIRGTKSKTNKNNNRMAVSREKPKPRPHPRGNPGRNEKSYLIKRVLWKAPCHRFSLFILSLKRRKYECGILTAESKRRIEHGAAGNLAGSAADIIQSLAFERHGVKIDC